jgi:ABC-type multidrug transport system fused ATPase/permease subunit
MKLRNLNFGNDLLKETLFRNYQSVILIICLMVLTGVVQATAVLGVIPIVDVLLNQDPNQYSEVTKTITNQFVKYNLPVNIVSLGVFYLLLIGFRSSILYVQKHVTNRTIFGEMRRMMLEELKAFLNASWSFFQNKEYGTLANTVITETHKATAGFESLARTIAIAITVFCYFALLLLISWQLTIIVFLSAAILLSPTLIVNKIVYKTGQLQTGAWNVAQGKTYEVLNALKLIAGFAKREDTLKNIEPSVHTIEKTFRKFAMIRVFLTLLGEPVGVILVIISGVVGMGYYDMQIATLTAFLYSINRLAGEAQQFILERSAVHASLPSFEQIDSLMQEAALLKEKSTGKKITSFSRGIYLTDLSFSYDSGENILSNINLEIPKGSMVALVGHSGSGKSTLIDLIMGFYFSHKGDLRIDKDNINEINLSDWRMLLGYIPQQPFLFNTSIRENLLWANNNARNSDIENACRLANAEEFILNLNDKYDAVVGERGVKLSGGEAQRICLARALIRRPKLLILDEATSSLDSHSELLIKRSIDNLVGETTIICVAHRLSTIQSADRIYHLEKGKIIEQGTFKELINSKESSFRKTAKLQGII